MTVNINLLRRFGGGRGRVTVQYRETAWPAWGVKEAGRGVAVMSALRGLHITDLASTRDMQALGDLNGKSRQASKEIVYIREKKNHDRHRW